MSRQFHSLGSTLPTRATCQRRRRAQSELPTEHGSGFSNGVLGYNGNSFWNGIGDGTSSDS